MLGADTFVSSILRLVTTIAILAAVYFFIVKPVLKTTNDVVHDTARQTRQASRQARHASDQAEFDAAKQRAQSYAQSALAGSQPWLAASREIHRCIADAGTSLPKMKHCGSEGEAIVSRALSPRNIATSYATSLKQEGDAAAAAKVRSCVADAGFKVFPMIRCKSLATRYLFG
jgi:hypothetical protein